MRNLKSTPRLFFTSAAGNAIGTYLAWAECRAFETEMSVPYTAQFFEFCARSGAAAYVVANTNWNTSFNAMVVSRHGITIEHRFGSARRSGLGWHLAQLTGSIGILIRLFRFRPDAAIISEATIAWFLLPVARLLRVKLYLSLHTRLWPETGKPRGAGGRVLLALNGWFLRNHCAGGVAASGEILEQVRELGCRARFETFLPSYRRQDIPAAERVGSGLFRVLFAGRIEVFKGVLDLIEVAEHLKARHGDTIRFEFCGRGSADDLLEREIERRGLQSNVTFHGFCDREQLSRLLLESDVVAVPSRTEFVEGYAQIVVEGAIAGKPVVTSRVCPAMRDIGDAAFEVEPDMWRGYADAIERLYLDRTLYERKAAAAVNARERYFDEANGWAAKVSAVMELPLLALVRWPPSD